MRQPRVHFDLAQKAVHLFAVQLQLFRQNAQQLDPVGEHISNLVSAPDPPVVQRRSELVASRRLSNFEAHDRDSFIGWNGRNL